jgi:hypothetical protein
MIAIPGDVRVWQRSDHAKGLVVLPSGGSSNERSHGSGGADVKDWENLNRKGARISAPRLNQVHAEKTMQSCMISPDRL